MTDNTSQPGTSAPGNAQRLEQLANMTQEADAANPSTEQQQQQQKQAEEATAADIGAKQWGMLMFTVGGFACMVAPELKQVYSEDRCFAWGQQANAVAEKYGWNGPSAMPELALIASTAGFMVPTYFLIREKIATAKDGKGPDRWLARVGLWWRTRKARAGKVPTTAPDGLGGQVGSEQ
jgi:hypothetical protein